MMPANGRLDLSTLTQVDGWAYLEPTTARAWVAACDELVSLGHPRPTITAPDGAYRPYAQQVAMKAYWTAQGEPENAASAGTSGHGWATDVDIFKNWLWPHALLVEVFGKYGFTFNVSWEAWHMHHNGTATASLDLERITEQDDDMPQARYIRNKDTGLVAWANPETGLWRQLPSPAYVDLINSLGGWDRTRDLDIPTNQFEFLKSVASDTRGTTTPVDIPALAAEIVRALPGAAPTAEQIAAAVIDATAAQYAK